jgi:hypothetical protein
MKKRCSRLIGHPTIAVSRAGRYTFVQAQNRTQTFLLIKACDKMNLGSARICKANLNTCVHQSLNDAVGTIHFLRSSESKPI